MYQSFIDEKIASQFHFFILFGKGACNMQLERFCELRDIAFDLAVSCNIAYHANRSRACIIIMCYSFDVT